MLREALTASSLGKEVRYEKALHLKLFKLVSPTDSAEEAKNGALFLFTNKRRNRLKALYFDRTGMCVLAKRLEIGTFSWPTPSQPNQQQLNLSPEALHLIFDGVDLRGPDSRPWYEREA